MSLLTKLTRVLVGNGEHRAEDTIPRLRQCYSGTVERARLLAKHAELAPHEAGRSALEQLAAEEKNQAERLRQAIMQLGGFAGDVRQTSEPAGALNYWARLVQNLEMHREAMRCLIEEATRLTEDLPELADSLRHLAREEEWHAERLRELIARSDPQAFD